MKLKNKLFAIFSLPIFLFACKKQDLPNKPQPSPFNITVQNPATVLSNGGKVLVDIKAGSDGWWIVIPAEAAKWCSSSQLFGSGDKTVTLNFSANSSGQSRSVSIHFNPTFNLPADSILFQQN